MRIIGANLGSEEGEYKKLSETNWHLSEEQKRLVNYLEMTYYILLENDNKKVSPFPIDEDNKAKIIPGMLNHRCANDIETLKEISTKGVLASEWFGIPESEREGTFCAFISRIKPDNYHGGMGDLAEDNHSRLNIGPGLVLFFDNNNPVMKYLIHLDYFEYAHLKKESPEKIKEIYTPEEIALLDKLIYELSPSGRDMRTKYDSKTNYWSAIPGGIPPYLINGVCIKNNKLTEEEISIISGLFPQALIFNGKREILSEPKEVKKSRT